MRVLVGLAPWLWVGRDEAVGRGFARAAGTARRPIPWLRHARRLGRSLALPLRRALPFRLALPFRPALLSRDGNPDQLFSEAAFPS